MLNVYNSKDSGTKAARMTDAEYEQWERGDTTEYAGFTIKPKRDFGERGFYDADTRRNVKEGWVIVKDGCNAMPGATWAHTQARATQMIDVFMAVDQDSQKFWHLLRAINAGEAEPVVKKKGEVSFILGYPQVDDAALAKFLEGVVGIIEDTSSIATSYIYEKVTESDGRDAYRQEGFGFMHTVGEVADMPVCVSLTCNYIRGHKILFVEATSRVVDHQMVREWIEQVAPDSAFEDGDRGKRLNISDANNWPNAIPREKPVVAA
jgi:hypothetical protein